MNNKKKYVAVLSSAALSALIVSAVAATPVSAKTVGFLAHDASGKYYGYDYTELLNSAVQKAMGFSAPLYDDYMAKTLVAFKDDVNGYVNEKAVIDASTAAAIAGTTFDLDNYTEKQAASSDILKVTGSVDQLTVDKDGKLVSVDASKTVESVSAIAVSDTTVGVVPTLPTTVNVTLGDGTTKAANITWDAAATTASTYATAGKVTIRGALADYNKYSVTATVNVNGAGFDVESIASLNVKQIKVTFNNAVDETSAETAANYIIGGASLEADPNGAVLQSDGKSVILNVSGTGLTNMQKYTLTVANVKDTSGNKITTKNTDFTVNDVTVPTVTSVVAKGNKVIELNFSAPVQNGIVSGNYTLDGSTLPTGVTPKVSADGTVVTLTNTTGTFTAGAHKVAVVQDGTSDLAAYNGYAVPSQSFDVNVTADTTAPAVASITDNDQTSVTVKFNKAMNIDTTADLAKFYWNQSDNYADNGNTADKITKVNDQTYKLSFTGTNKPLPTGNVYFFVNGVKDYSANPLAGNVDGQANIYGTQIAVNAVTAPSVASVTSKGNNIIYVNFATAMDATIAQNSANYLVKASDGTVVTVNTAAWGTTDNKQIQLTTSSAMKTGTYTVQVNNVKDVVGNVLNTQPISVNVTDTSKPSFTPAGYEGQSFVLNFDRAMAVTGVNSVLNTANYQYQPSSSGSADVLPAGTTITAFNSNKSVRITVPSTTTLNAADKIYVGSLSGTTLNTIADANGNLYGTDNGIAIGSSKPVVDITTGSPAMKSKDASTLKVTLDSSVNKLDKLVASDFRITVDGGSAVIPTAAVLDTTDTTNHTILFTLPSGTTLGSSSAVTVGTIHSPSTTDIYGATIAGDKTTTSATITNGIAPTLGSAVFVSPTKIDVTFSGQLSNMIDAANSIEIVQGTKVLTGLSITGSPKAGNVIEFTLANADALDPTQAIAVKTVGADFMTAKDSNGNLLVANTTGVTVNSFAASDVAVNIAGGAIASNDTIGLTFNRNIDLTSIVSNWTDGTVAQDAIMTFNSDGTANINGANVGTFSGFTVPTTGNIPVKLTSATPTTLTIKFGTAGSTVATANGVVKFTPSANVKSTSGLSVGSYQVSTAVDAIPEIASLKINNGTDANATITQPIKTPVTPGTITLGISGINNYTTGSATLTEKVKVSIDKTIGNYNAGTQVTVNPGDNLANTILSIAGDNGTTGISPSTLKAELNGATITLTDMSSTPNTDTYTLTIN